MSQVLGSPCCYPPRDVPCRAVPRSGGSVPCQIFPCRALRIRAVPNISVPCHAWPCQDLGTRSWYQDLGTEILVPRSWYQDLGTRILVPRSWYQDPDTKILARHGTEIFGTARIIRARHGNPPPPVKGGTGVFLTRHGTSESQILERL